MERLISSSSPSSYSLLPNHHHQPRRLLPNSSPAAAVVRLRYSPPLPRLCLKLAAAFHQADPPPPFRPSYSASLNNPSCFLSSEAEKPKIERYTVQPLQPGRDIARSLLRRVAYTLVSVLLSASVVTLLQSIITLPAYATVQSAAKVGGPVLKTELLSSAWTGFLAGCLHTLSGPDHLAALAPLSIGRSRVESAVVGALWGCGHDAGQVIFGLLFLLLKDRLHIEVIRTWGTRVVGITLLVIGAMGIREASEVPAPCVALENGECDVGITDHLEIAPRKKNIGFATFATGIVHGLQPDALLMVLPALALPSRLAGAAFLGMFLVGTVLAMGSYTVFIGSCSEALKERVPRITEKLTWAASLVAISMGVAILISQLFGFSLY